MNEKISGGEVFCIVIYIIAVSFFGIINTTTLRITGNTTLISFLISIVIGLIPVLMIMYICKKINTSFFDFLKNNFSIFSYIIIAVLIIMTLYLIFIFSFIFLDFVIGQFLTKTSYYFISISLFIFVFYCVQKGIEVISRTTFILFVFSFVIFIFFLITLIPYTDLNNLKPYIDSSNTSILKSIYITVSMSSFPLILVLGLKDKVTNFKKLPRKIFWGYVVSMCLMFLFLLFTILIYGIDFSKILTYPSYSLFKKVQIFGFIERIENIVSIIFFSGFYAVFIYYVYFVKDNICNIFKIKRKKVMDIITFIVSLGTSTLSVYLFKNYDLDFLIDYSYYIVSVYFLIILILFIRCIFIKEKA